MSFESKVTDTDFDPELVQLAEELRRDREGCETDFSVDGLEDSLGQRLLRLFRR